MEKYLNKITQFVKENKLILIIILIIIFISFDAGSNINKIDSSDILKNTYYINLEHRRDRKEDTLRELKSFGIHNPIRFGAIKEESGAIGCSKSHLEVLKIARKNNYPYVSVFEDDVKFLDPYLTAETLNNVINSGINWDVILLGGNNYPPYEKINNDCVRVENCQTTTGYLVKQSYYDTLINHWSEGLSKLIETNDGLTYALDQYWKILQSKDNFLLLTPLNVVQRESYSDIEKKDVNYTNLMENIK